MCEVSVCFDITTVDLFMCFELDMAYEDGGLEPPPSVPD